MHCVYVLKSLGDSKNYVGVTGDLEKRIKAHNWGRVSSTKPRRPFELIYVEEFESREIAEKRELKF
jgi:putative endonuclease